MFVRLNISKIAIVLVLVCGMLFAAGHHHKDLDAHRDCPVCAVVHGGLDCESFVSSVSVFFVFLYFLDETKQSEYEIIPLSKLPRGPPCYFT